MMDILRTRLEVVLAKHGVFFQATAPLLDDLVACLPQPSREELLRLLMPIYEANNVSASVIEKILDVAMTWATTPEEKKIWCSHLQWSSQSYWIEQLESADGVMRVPGDWKCCPLCATLRPPEA